MAETAQTLKLKPARRPAPGAPRGDVSRSRPDGFRGWLELSGAQACFLSYTHVHTCQGIVGGTSAECFRLRCRPVGANRASA